MSINVLADRVLEFRNDNGLKVEKETTKIGFNSLPDWVENDPYYKLAISDGCLKAFQGTSDKAMENVLKEKEYQDKIATLQAQIDEKDSLLSALDKRTVAKAAAKVANTTDDQAPAGETPQPTEGQ